MQTAIALNNLHVSPLNMRAEKKPPTLKRMAEISANILPTVREKGILSDLIVRPNNSGFEILAGRRRYYAAKVIESERGEYPDIKCDVRENCSDAEALEISLIENVAREDADELAEYETYAGLIKLGKKPGEIALTRTPFSAHSRARNCVRLRTAALAAPYATTRESGIMPAIEAMLIIEP